jgi:hypothetical protein
MLMSSILLCFFNSFKNNIINGVDFFNLIGSSKENVYILKHVKKYTQVGIKQECNF